MSETKEVMENQIEIRKKVFLMVHEDNINEKILEPLLLIDGDRIHIAFLKRKANTDMYYIFNHKTYLKLWNDQKGNLLVFFDNWSGDLFINNPQKEEYIDGFKFTTMESKIICENREGKRKKIELQGFDIIPLIINQFEKHANAILYILCYKLS